MRCTATIPQAAFLSLGLVLASQAAWAQLDKVVVNDVRPWVGTTGVTEIYPSQVTLFNAGTTAVDLGSYEVRAVGDTLLSIPLPSWLMLPGTSFVVDFGAAPASDALLGDGNAVYAPPGTVGVLFADSGEVGLYAAGVEVDHVAWRSDSTAADEDFDLKGQWTPNQFVDTTDFYAFSHLSRIPSGYDTDTPGDWQQVDRQNSFPVVAHNDVPLVPPSGALFAAPDTLFWREVTGATAYHLQVAADTVFTTLVLDTTLAATQLSVDLPDDTWMFWRVLPVLPGGPYPASVWSFYVLGSGAPAAAKSAPGPAPQINLAQHLQHKDTRLLCLWNLGAQRIAELQGKVLRRHGCFITPTKTYPSGPWNAAHATTAAHIFRCNHCNMYCTRASIQMVNNHFNGTLFQDEISYHMKRGENPGPEGDLGHQMGEANQQTLLSTLRWAMQDNNGVQLAQAADNSFVQIGNEIAAMRPIVVGLTSRLGVEGTESHCIVINGYRAPMAMGQVPWVYITDPLPDTPRVRRTGWYAYTALRANFYFTLPNGVMGTLSNPLVVADPDSDKVMSFDEGLLANGQMDPARRNLESRADVADTDGDGINDRQEIGSYTFHREFHLMHPRDDKNKSPVQKLEFPDVDDDKHRAENDSDSDGDGVPDGTEDCNRNGKSPEAMPNPACAMDAMETCVYDSLSPPPVPVAVTLQAFEVSAGDERVVLRWEIQDDGAGGRFVIRRDGIAVHSVPMNGSGRYAWIDQQVKNGSRHDYELLTVSGSGVVSLLSERNVIVGPGYRFALDPVHPNPFNPSATVRFELPERRHVFLELLDVAGRRVVVLADEDMEGGRHDVEIRVPGLASGVYALRLRAGRQVQSRKIVVLR